VKNSIILKISFLCKKIELTLPKNDILYHLDQEKADLNAIKYKA